MLQLLSSFREKMRKEFRRAQPFDRGRHDWEAVVCTCCFIGCYFSSWTYHEFTCDVVQCILTQKCNSKERLPQVPTKKCRTDSLEFSRAWGFSDVLSLNAQTIHVRDFCWNTTLSENANTYPQTPNHLCMKEILKNFAPGATLTNHLSLS